MKELALEREETRLVFWERILQDRPPAPEEIDSALLAVTRDGEMEDRVAFALLQACANISRADSDAMKRNLKIALLCWFSGVRSCEAAAPSQTSTGKPPHVYEIVGAHLTWREAALMVGGNPEDYSARPRLLKRLKEECIRQWSAAFGDSTYQPFEVAIDAA